MNNKIPIFPLSNVIFFPGTDLPLNIFEKKYVEMIDHSLKKERLIGIVQPKIKKDFNLSDSIKDLYSIGCVGKISSFSETEDKRYLINLKGISKFKILEEVKNEYLFREFKVQYIDSDIQNISKEKLKIELMKSELEIGKLKIFLKKKGLSLNWKEIDNLDFENIINAICMIVPISISEKQTLLETENILKRFEMLKNIISFDLLDEFENKTIQ